MAESKEELKSLLIKVKVKSRPTLCDPLDCSLPDFSVHGILQARILEWVAISLSRGSSRPRDRTQVSRIGGRHFNLWATREAQIFLYGKEIHTFVFCYNLVFVFIYLKHVLPEINIRFAMLINAIRNFYETVYYQIPYFLGHRNMIQKHAEIRKCQDRKWYSMIYL